MNIEIHELQKLSPKLLIALYADKRLALTPAIAAIGNNYYPSIDQILETLSYYSDVDIVISFVSKNATVIEDAKKQIEKSRSSSFASNDEAEMGASEDTGNGEDALSADTSLKQLGHRPLKTVTIEQIESAISKALFELTGQEYEVDVNRFDLNPELNAWASDSALLDLKLRKRSTFDAASLFG